MDSIIAAWDMALSAQAPLEDAALVETLLAWARAQVEEMAQYSENNTHNVFATAAIAKSCDNANGRPDLIQLCKIPELTACLLSFPQSSKWTHVRAILQEVHQQQPLKKPALGDDAHWLTLQAKRLCNLRTNATFAKKYPCRVQYRCSLLSPGDLATLALMLQKMAHVPISETISKPLMPERAEPERAATAATSPLRTPQPIAPADQPAALGAAPPTPALEDLFSPSPAAPPTLALEDLTAPPCTVDSMGIPLMFAPPPPAPPPPATLKSEMLGHARQRQAGEGARPVHKGAASKHFAKEGAGPAQKTPVKAQTPVKAKRDKKQGKSAQKQSKPASAPKKRSADDSSVVSVKITHPKSPPRTYVQAWWQEKWRHVITVAAHEHAKHCEIVEHVGEELRSGRLTYDQAREQKKILLSAWAK